MRSPLWPFTDVLRKIVWSLTRKVGIFYKSQRRKQRFCSGQTRQLLVVEAERLEVGPMASVERENRPQDAIWLRLYRRCDMRPERASVTTCAARPRWTLLHRPLPKTSSPGSRIKSGLIQVVNVDHDVLNVLIQPQAFRVGNPVKAVDDVKVAAVHSLTRCEE